MPNLVNWALLGTAQWKRFSLALQLSYFLKFSRTVCDILKECHTELRGSSWWFHCFLRDVLHQGFLKMDIQIDMNPVQLVVSYSICLFYFVGAELCHLALFEAKRCSTQR
eukprot:s152_g12.t1